MVTSRLEYLRNSTEQERENGGEELEANAAAITSTVQLSSNNPAYKDVDIYVNVGGERDWLFTVGLDKKDNSFSDAAPRYSPTSDMMFEEKHDVPSEVQAELQRVRPIAVCMLLSGLTLQNHRDGKIVCPVCGREWGLDDDLKAGDVCPSDDCPTAFNRVPLRTDIPFSDAPGELGGLWALAGQAENALAAKLSAYPEGTAVLGSQEDVWFLRIEDGQRVLCHALNKGGEVTEVSNRFEFDLMWVDVEADELRDYAERVQVATAEFGLMLLDL